MFKTALLELSKSSLIPFSVRKYIYSLLGLTLPKKTIVLHQCQFSNPDLSSIKIGTNCFINEYCYLENNASITIEDNVAIAMHTKIITTTHPISSSEKRVTGRPLQWPVRIGKGCWIGCNVTILPGVSIGQGTVIAAGSVVTNNCKPNSLYAGVPAQWKRYLD